jgi:hypothetical protein
MRSYFSSSVLLHLGLIGTFWLALVSDHAVAPPKAMLPSHFSKTTGFSLKIETDTQGEPTAPKQASRPTRSREARSQQNAVGQSKKLLPGTGMTLERSAPQEPKAEELARAMDAQTEAELSPFLKALFDRINEGLRYPSEIIEDDRAGEVSLTLTVDSQGKLLEGFTQVRADDRILKVYVFQMLRRALAEPLRVSLPSDRPKLEVQARFQFYITFSRNSVPPESASIVRNSLSFRRVVIHPGYSEMATGGLDTSGTSFGVQARGPQDPSAPVHRKMNLDREGIFNLHSNSGSQAIGVGVDVAALAQKIFGKRKAKIDPLERYEDDPDY